MISRSRLANPSFAKLIFLKLAHVFAYFAKQSPPPFSEALFINSFVYLNTARYLPLHLLLPTAWDSIQLDEIRPIAVRKHKMSRRN